MMDEDIYKPIDRDLSEAERDAAQKTRRKLLTTRPKGPERIDRVPCTFCRKMMPLTWFEHELYIKCLCIDGQLYCIDCAKLVAKGLQKELMNTTKTERRQYYKNIEDKIAEHEAIEKTRMEAIVDEIDLKDTDKMKKLMRNKSGSTDGKDLRGMIQDNINKELHKDE